MPYLGLRTTPNRMPDEPVVPPRDAPAALVSATLANDTREVIGDALRSVVDWVDWCLVIDTGITDDTLAVARAVAGDKLRVRRFPWCDDFAAARNSALEAAAETGAAWALMLDTDERLEVGCDVRAALTASTADVLRTAVVTAGRTHHKDRFFRLPAQGCYVGLTHEYFRTTGRVAHAAGIRVRELLKTPAAVRQRAERDVPLLTRYSAEHPNEPRWHDYLGRALAQLGRDEEAVTAFCACAGLSRCDEKAAQCLYRAALSLTMLERHDEALAACAAGMDRHDGLADLPYLASVICWDASCPEDAAHWARLAIARGHFAGGGGAASQMMEAQPVAGWEGPYAILAWVAEASGDDDALVAAVRNYLAAEQARVAETMGILPPTAAGTDKAPITPFVLATVAETTGTPRVTTAGLAASRCLTADGTVMRDDRPEKEGAP